jgi:hypothetical protein
VEKIGFSIMFSRSKCVIGKAVKPNFSESCVSYLGFRSRHAHRMTVS